MGERACTVRDDQGNPIPMPGQPWQRPSANAVIEARGIYRQSIGALGLMLQVSALRLSSNSATEGEQQQQHDPFA